MKKLLCLCLTALLTVGCLCPVARAADDVSGHWAEPYFRALSAHSVINPNGKGQFTPSNPIARAEFMRYVNRAFDFTEQADISAYTDVPSGQWYYETVRIAVHYGYISGLSDSKMSPEGAITREQVITILGRLCKLQTEEVAPGALPFSDRSSIASWSAPYIKWGVDNGYVSGYQDGSFQPKRPITRAEAAKILYTFLGTMMDGAGKTYTAADLIADAKNALVTQPCTLRGLTIPGNLILSEGLGDGLVMLQDVTVRGRLVALGGDVVLDRVQAGQLYVDGVASTRDLSNALTNSGSTGSGTGQSTVPVTPPSGSQSGLVVPSVAQFSAQSGAAAYRDLTVSLQIGSDVVVQAVTAGTQPLTLGTQYGIDGTTVTLYSEALAWAASGVQGQLPVHFVLSDGRSAVLTVQLI